MGVVDRLIDEFWTEVTTGWEPPERMIQWWRAARPELPDHPTAAQLKAWIELAELVRDTGVRQAVRRELHQVPVRVAGCGTARVHNSGVLMGDTRLDRPAGASGRRRLLIPG